MGKTINLKETLIRLEVFYLKQHGVDFDKNKSLDNQIKKLGLFPDEWYSVEFGNDFRTRIETVSRAINENKLISDTDYYKKHMKGKAQSVDVVKMQRQYSRMHGYFYTNRDDPVMQKIFPKEWYYEDAIPEKIEILNEAINDNKRIDETASYERLMKGKKKPHKLLW